MRTPRFGLVAMGVAALWAQSPKLPTDEMTMTAQAFSPVLTLEAQSNLVDVPVVVRDGDDHAVGTLGRADFRLLVDGKPQAITSFSVEHGAEKELVPTSAPAAAASVPPAAGPAARVSAPQVVAFYFDDLNSNTFDLGSARKMAERYFAGGLEPNTRAAIFTHTGADMLNLTTDLDQIRAVLARIQPHPGPGIPAACPIQPDLAYEWVVRQNRDALSQAEVETEMCRCTSTRNFCAQGVKTEVDMKIASAWDSYEQQAGTSLETLESIVNYLGKQPGTRTLILSSSGIMTQTKHPEWQKLTDAALRARVIIDTVDAKGLVAPNGVNDSFVGAEIFGTNEGLQLMADYTGGRYYHDRNDLDRAYHEFAGTPETSYMLAFAPSSVAADGALHKIAVKVRGYSDLQVQARTGFYAPKSPALPAADLGQQQGLNKEVFATDALTGINAVMNAAPAAGMVHVAVAVDPVGIPFAAQNDRQVEQLTFVAALLDSQGQFVSGSQGTMELKLKSSTLAAISKPGTGLSAGLMLTAPAGSYRLRLLVEEANGGKMATFTRDVIIP